MIKITCLWCGKEKFVFPSVIKKSHGKFCSQSCKAKYYCIALQRNPMFSEEVKKKVSDSKKGKKYAKSKIVTDENTIIVKARNTGNEFIFDYDESILRKLKETGWNESADGYLISTDGNNIRAHHLVLPPKKGFLVDHINRNTKNNRKNNLRYVTFSESNFNREARKNSISGYIGVIWREKSQKWISRITKNYKLIYLGSFDCLDDAIRARRKAEEMLFPGIKIIGE